MAESKEQRPEFCIYPLTEEAKSLYVDSVSNLLEDSGVDVRFPENITIGPGETALVFLSIRAWCRLGKESVPFRLLPRSSIGKTTLLAEEFIEPLIGSNGSAGLVEYHPVGLVGAVLLQEPEELAIRLTNHGDTDYNIIRGVALFQLAECCLRPPTVKVVSEWAPYPVGGLTIPKKSVDFLINGVKPPMKNATVYTTQEYKIPARTTIDIPLGIRACCLVDGEPEAFFLYPFFEVDADDFKHLKFKTEGLRQTLGESMHTMPLVLKNWLGLIDKGYRGEIKAKLFNESFKEFIIPKGFTLFGLLSPYRGLRSVTIVPDNHSQFAVGATARGTGGFGSTGAAGKT